jgi:hypothetical protein
MDNLSHEAHWRFCSNSSGHRLRARTWRLRDYGSCRAHFPAWRDPARDEDTPPGHEVISLTNGKTTCSGTFDGYIDKDQQSWTYPIACSDGRTGIATDTTGGGGKVRFSDGTEADLIFGEGAKRI